MCIKIFAVEMFSKDSIVKLTLAFRDFHRRQARHFLLKATRNENVCVFIFVQVYNLNNMKENSSTKVTRPK